MELRPFASSVASDCHFHSQLDCGNTCSRGSNTLILSEKHKNYLSMSMWFKESSHCQAGKKRDMLSGLK